MKEFESWRDIKSWAEKHNFGRLAQRLQLNNDCWQSSGEFGRSQVAICDAMRFADSEDERLKIANEIEQELADDIVLQCLEKEE